MLCKGRHAREALPSNRRMGWLRCLELCMAGMFLSRVGLQSTCNCPGLLRNRLAQQLPLCSQPYAALSS